MFVDDAHDVRDEVAFHEVRPYGVSPLRRGASLELQAHVLTTGYRSGTHLSPTGVVPAGAKSVVFRQGNVVIPVVSQSDKCVMQCN